MTKSGKALSSAIAILMLIVIVLAITVPMAAFFINNQSSAEAGNALVNNYIYLKNLQVKQVEYGHPGIYYSNSSIYFAYTNGTFVPQSNVTVTNILYFKDGIWYNVPAHYPLVIGAYTNLTLPKQVQGHPIIIVTSFGNLFFLSPESSIGPYSTSGKGGVIIAAEISEPGNTIGVSTNATTNINGPFKNYTTPVAFPNQTGTFSVGVPQYVFYEMPNGSIVTGVFHNWIVSGALVNSTNSQGIKVNLQGVPASLTASYTAVTQYVNLQVNLGKNYGQPITIAIDGIKRTITESQNFKVLAGYVNVTIYTTQFNVTSPNAIYQHSYQESTYNGKSYSTTSFIIFIQPSSTNPSINIQFINSSSYYKVYINYNNATPLPPNVSSIEYPILFSIEYPILWKPVEPCPASSVNFTLDSSVYQYNTKIWVKNGTYIAGGTGLFVPGPPYPFYFFMYILLTGRLKPIPILLGVHTRSLPRL
ncbi:hypothetical protein [Metallosphaera cuprina]|uniref:Uncharacterized protein n=1 Tax=Metallosphaera cuprina (strain Ar-4) TaxID=1006006 RepID=F4G101_METCR|nr:hypothetical protein [Metallosphaera cuprina]AEB94691.1 conserved hypothetical protein [Metallosphaera cuprina Ar-4]